jgi:hypothetical protein
LQLPQLVFLFTELLIQLGYFTVVVTLFVKSLKSLFLLALHFEERLVFFLDAFQDALLVFQLIF